MRPITVSVGPLGAAGSGNNIVAGTTPTRPGPQQLNFSAALAPTSTWSGNATVTGNVLTITATTTGAMSPGPLSGTGVPPNTVVTGPGASAGQWLISPALPGAPLTLAGARVGAVVPLDVPRQVVVGNSEAAGTVTFTVYGTNAAGQPISETMVSTGANLVTQANFATVTQVTVSGPTAGIMFVGTQSVATSPWVMFDPWADSKVTYQTEVAGGVPNYTVQITNDDPNSPTNPVTPSAVQWAPDPNVGMVGATTNQFANWQFAPLFARLLLNSGTGSVSATFIQSGAVNR